MLFMSVLVSLFYLKNESFRKIILTPPFVFWLLWVIYAFFNTVSYGMYMNLPNFSFFALLFIPLVAIWLINIEQFQDRTYIFNVIILGLFIRLLISYFFESGNIQDFDDRLGGKINANEVAVSAVVLICFIFLKYFHNEIKLTHLIILALFPAYIIVISGSRGSFGAMMFLFITFLFINRTHRSIKDFVLLLIGLFIGYLILSFILEDTYLGYRLSGTLEQGNNIKKYEKLPPLLQKFGDRGIFYQLGFKIFLDNPIRGIGLGNFIKYSGKVVQHSEYMIQLCELGIIGSTLFLMYYGYLGRNLIYLRRMVPLEIKLIEAYISVLLVILLIAFSLFQYNLVVFFLLSGSIIGFIKLYKSRITSGYDG